jgi:hypothetical protein
MISTSPQTTDITADKSNEYLFTRERDENEHKFIYENRTRDYNFNCGDIFSIRKDTNKDYYNYLAKNSNTYSAASIINGEFINDSFGNNPQTRTQARTPMKNKNLTKGRS